MKFFQPLARSLHSLAKLFEGQSPRSASTADMLGFGAQTHAGVAVTEETALTISAVYCAVTIISETSATMPYNVLTRLGGRRKEVAYKHPAYTVIHDEPNEEMSAFVFWTMYGFYGLLWGNSYAEIGWDMGGNCRALYLLEPWRVQPKRDKVTRKIYYDVDQGQRRIEAKDMLHVPNKPLDGITGRSVVTWARESFGLSLAAETYGSSFFGSGGVPSGVLEHPASLKQDTRKEIRKEWNATHSPTAGGRNNEVAILWEGMKYNKIGLPPEDAQFLATRDFQIPEVARWFNIPPHLLRSLMKSSYSTNEQQGIEFLLYTMMPRLVEREQEVDRKLLNRPKHFSKHNVYALLRGDSAAQSQFFKEMLGIGVFSQDDIRELMDMNPIDGDVGDRHYLPSAMTPLDRIDEDIDARIKSRTAPPEPALPPGGDGKAPLGDTGQKPIGQKKDSRLQAAQAACLSDALGRMVRKEVAAVNRATNNPGKFLSTVDEFYEKHPALLAEAIGPAVAVCLATHDPDIDPLRIAERIASDHCHTSYTALLSASEVTSAQLSESVAALTSTWPTSRTTIDLEALCQL